MPNLGRLLLSHRRHVSNQSQILTLIRSLCSTSSSPIRPVSYPVKPKDPEPQQDQNQESKPSLPQSQPHPPPQCAERESLRLWTREDVRFVRDAPSISPISYPSRVAPLPEDRTKEEAEKKGEDEELRREAADGRVRTSFGLQEEERIPFPTIIKQEKRPQKASMDLSAAIREVKANAMGKFIETVEAHVNLGVDPRRNQNVRGSVILPHGTGKTVRVAVFAEGAVADEAREAGADIVGGDDLIEEIKKGNINFDKCIATTTFMTRLSKMGSVTNDVAPTVKAAKSGRIDFKNDKTAIVHAGLGKVDFSEEALRENIGAFVNSLLQAKPFGLKKTSKYVGYVKNFTLSSTMGPGFPVTIQSLSAAADNYIKLQVQIQKSASQ